MEEQIIKLVPWGLGLCFSGFLFLLGVIHKMKEDIQDRVTRKELQSLKNDILKDIDILEGKVDTLEKSIGRLSAHMISEFGGEGTIGNTSRVLNELTISVKEMHDLLVGTVKEDGLITEFREIKKIVYEQVKG